ncbi:MAG: hypothetical protein IMY72_14630 [Bacteroidetes bacterium]|nr:hypothetical protein [Bacteroidota bacterium]
MKKTLNIVIAFLISFFVISFFGSCEKAKEDKIVGDWRLISEKEPVPEELVTHFVFFDDNTVKLVSDVTLIADYSVSSENLHYYLKIIGFEVSFISLGGKYLINELSKDVLKITRVELSNGEKNGAFKRLEFIKE